MQACSVTLLVSLLAWCAFPSGLVNAAAKETARQHSAMHSLFQALDVDGDGQVKSTEALKYLKEHWKDGPGGGAALDEASHAFIEAVDTGDEGETVSEQELSRSLSERLQVRLESMSLTLSALNDLLQIRFPVGSQLHASRYYSWRHLNSPV